MSTPVRRNRSRAAKPRQAKAPASAVTTKDPAQVDSVEEAGKDSFPASDPPSWTLGTGRSDDD